MNSNCLAGIFPILATTFTDDGALDLESQASLIEYLLRQGAHGLGLFGNASEGYALTESERRQLLRLIVKQVNGRVPLVVSTGHTGTDAAIEASREAEAEGATALMMLPPYYVKTGSDGLMHYYQSISSKVSIPIMIQDAPLMSQVTMPAALLARMEREIENVRYVKVEAPPTAPKTTEVLRASEGKLIVFGGLNCQFLYEELERGARGAMPNSDIAGIYVRIWDYFQATDTREAWRLFVHALPLMRFGLQPGLGVSAAKHNLRAAGVIRSAAVRHPTGSLTPESLKELEILRSWVNGWFSNEATK
jgi:4-hydroxy-tetrahydrodipicolinate synthase